jgi:hypothetical protein
MSIKLAITALPAVWLCGCLARPNVLMFGDSSWLASRTEKQAERLQDWLAGVARLVVLELGAGKAIPTVRNQGERLTAPLVRINPRDFDVYNRRSVGSPVGALKRLRLLHEILATG